MQGRAGLNDCEVGAKGTEVAGKAVRGGAASQGAQSKRTGGPWDPGVLAFNGAERKTEAAQCSCCSSGVPDTGL